MKKAVPYHSVRNSKIHGRGVFSRRPIRKGTKIIEYTGPIVSAKEADQIGANAEDGHTHTMLFQIDKDRVINGNEGGDARFINHSCDPNCETVQYGDQIFIEALRSIRQGEELLYDYHLQVTGKITEKERKEYACFCGSPLCRGTQIAPDILAKQAKKDEKKRLKKLKKEAEQLQKQTKKEEDKKRKEDKKNGEKKSKNAKKSDKKNGKNKDKKKENIKETTKTESTSLNKKPTTDKPLPGKDKAKSKSGARGKKK